MSKLLQYYVEGECEEKLIKAFQHEDKGFLIGKIDIFNPAERIISKLRISQLKKGTTIVLVYDVDVANEKIIEENVKLLKASKNISSIIHVQSIDNFEDEIIYSSQITNINSVFKTKSVNEFKNKFIAHKDIIKKLHSIGFDIRLIWSRKTNKIKVFENEGNKIKNKKK